MKPLAEWMKQVEERLGLALKDPSFALRVNIWLTAGDGRQFCANAPTDLATALKVIKTLIEQRDELLGPDNGEQINWAGVERKELNSELDAIVSGKDEG